MKAKKPKSSAGSSRTREEINAKVKAVVSDRKNLNDILELRDNLVVSAAASKSDVHRAVASLRGLVEIFQHYIIEGDLDEVGENEEGRVKLCSWFNERLEEVWQRMLSMLASKEESLNEFALVGLFRVVRAFFRRRMARDNGEGVDHWSGEESRLLRSLLPVLCSCDNSREKQIKRFKEFTEYWDVKQHVLQGLAKFLKTRKDEVVESDQMAHFKSNLLGLLEIIDFRQPKNKEKANLPTFLCNEDHAGDDAEGAKSLYQFNYESVQKAFNEVWEYYLKLKMDPSLYKRLLVMLDDRVLPHLTRPLLLTDFLLESYSVGGAVSILALGGLFTLIQRYNLEYPDFYEKLYALFTREAFHARYRARFLHMADLFLTSTHLPEYLVAAFAKRVARLSLSAPANAILAIFPFVGNLLIRHRGLTRMVYGSEDVNKQEELECDPYLPDESDPSKCRAVESSLWELTTLQNHALPQVSKAAKAFVTAKRLPEMEWDLGEYLELSMEDMMGEETKKKPFVNVPLTFERPTGAKLRKNDLTDKFFKLI